MFYAQNIFSWAGGNYLPVPSSLETDDRFKKTVALRAETDPNKTKYLIDKSSMLATFNNLNVVLSSDCSPNHTQEFTASHVSTTRLCNNDSMFTPWATSPQSRHCETVLRKN